MNFSSATRVIDTIRASDEVEQIRGINRTKVIELFNNDPPLSAEEAKKMGLRINVAWGEGPVLAAHARRQYDNATLGTQNFFKVTIPNAPTRDKMAWELFITQHINGVMKKNRVYVCQKEYQAASILGAGIAPTIWRDRESWCYKFVKACDLRVPTDTKTSLEEQGWFAERHGYTPGELARKVFGKNSVPGYNKPAIKKILNEYADTNYEQTEYTWLTAPEKMADLWRQNAGYYASDAMPTISLWHFYFLDEDDPINPKWKMRVVADYGDQGVRGAPDNDFLFNGNKSYADNISQLLHVQFGDFNSDPPFMWYGVRSLGFLLVDPCFWTNITRCRELQHLHEVMNILFRVSDPNGRARAQKIQLFDRAILEEGVSIVPANERHQVDSALVEQVMAQLKQLQREVAVTYTQDIDTGTQKEQTAFETHARLSAVNAMMGALLSRYFRNETFAFREICRRFCLRKSNDKDAKAFQEACARRKIPPEFVNEEQWNIEPEVPMGAGNPTLAMAQSQQIMQVRPMLDPTAQQEALHEHVEVITGDYRKAERWVPLDKKRDVSDAKRDAEFAFGTLMQGVPVEMKEGLNPIDQIETLLGLMAGKIAALERSGGMATASDLLGLQTVSQYVQQLIQQLAQDETQKERVTSYMKAFGKLMNMLKAFGQRLQQQQSQNGDGQLPAEAHAKIGSALVKAQVEGKIKEKKAAQTQRHKDIAYEREQRRRDAEAFSEIQRDNLKARSKHFENPDMQ